MANEDDDRLFKIAVDDVLCCADPNVYREKIKGFTKGAYGMSDKQERYKDLGSKDYKSL